LKSECADTRRPHSAGDDRDGRYELVARIAEDLIDTRFT
jgi:hypothetical protein